MEELHLNEPGTSAYKKFFGRIVNRMPELIASSRVPMNTVQQVREKKISLETAVKHNN